MLNALDVSKYILSLPVKDKGYVISNLTLQKLLYYCQGYYLGYTGERLFAESVEAWEHGPVVNNVYDEYKKYKKDSIPSEILTLNDKKKYSREQIAIINFVFKQYSVYSAHELREMTHNESPWKKVYKPGKEHLIIKDKHLKAFFIPVVEKINELIFNENTKKALKQVKYADFSTIKKYKFGF
jgi:uncharacterized phage-associated protein